MAAPYLIIHYGENYSESSDISEYVKELKISCEDIDDKNSGRDDKTGIMMRTRVLRVHTLDVTLRRVTQPQARSIHSAVMDLTNPFIKVEYSCPCAGRFNEEAYCSRMNYGAQRYNKRTNTCFFDGITFTIVERGHL